MLSILITRVSNENTLSINWVASELAIKVVSLVIFVVALVASQNADPDFTPLFGLKRVQEKIFLNFKSTPEQQADYKRSLLNIRLAELGSQVKRQSYGYILPSALRYSSLAGEITETIVANNMKDQATYTVDQFTQHQKVLQEIYVIYPKNTDNEEYKYIEDDVNYLKIYLDKLLKLKSS